MRYRVTVPFDGLFDAKVRQLRDRGNWAWLPQYYDDATNCSDAAFAELRAGGARIKTPTLHPYSPDDLYDALKKLSKKPGSGVTQLPNVPW